MCFVGSRSSTSYTAIVVQMKVIGGPGVRRLAVVKRKRNRMSAYAEGEYPRPPFGESLLGRCGVRNCGVLKKVSPVNRHRHIPQNRGPLGVQHPGRPHGKVPLIDREGYKMACANPPLLSRQNR